MAITIDQLEIQIVSESQKATKGIDKLISTLGRFSNASDKAGGSLGGFFSNLKNGSGSFEKFTSNLTRQIVKWRTLIGVFKSAAKTMGNWFKESNNYIETLNLFNVTMGEGAEAAMSYAEKVQELMGIDIAEWMNYQGTFKQLTSGFGVAEKAANTMSQNLTQLSYDLASFFNTDVETAFEKLSSAMAGQVKGLREFGIDTTVASLQEYALAKGIDTSVRSMTQAEKSLLRYNYIMENSIKIQGDMARTIITPANALRILNAQLTQMKRAFGNIVSVLVTQIIPYVQVFVQLVTEGAQKLAAIFGFELPTIDYSGLGTGGFAADLEDAEESTGGVADKLKEIKKQLMGFDELNIINNPDKSSGGGSGVSGGGGGLNMDPLEYDFLKNLDTSKLDEIKQKLKDILEYAPIIGAAFAAWNVGKLLAGLLDSLLTMTALQKLGLIVGITLSVIGVTLEWKGIISSIKEGLSKINFTEILTGGGLTIGGAAMVGAAFGQTLLAAAIGSIVAGVPMYFAGIYDACVKGLNWLNSALIPIGSTLAGAGIGAIIGSLGGPIGAAVGLQLGLITDYIIWWFQNVPEWLDEHVIVPIREKLSKVTPWIDNNILQPVIAFFTPIRESINYVVGIIQVKIIEIKNGITRVINAVWFKVVEIKNKIVEIFNALIVNVVSPFYKKHIHPVVTSIRAAISALWKTLKAHFIDKIADKLANLKIKLLALRDTVANAFKSIGTTVVNFVSNSFKSVINGVLTMAENAINRFIRMLNGAIGIINKIPGVNITTVSELSIPRLAEGGMVDTGQMFIAREAGPELVGRIGNKTTVANNDQIIAGIESGVYRAMVAANSSGGGTQTIRIINEIDGDVVGERVIKYHNGIVMQTGESPLFA